MNNSVICRTIIEVNNNNSIIIVVIIFVIIIKNSR